jgi:hypothetical protein
MLDFFRCYYFNSEQELERSGVCRYGYGGVMALDSFWHYFSLLAFLFSIKAFLDCFKDQSICSLDGSVGLWMIN